MSGGGGIRFDDSEFRIRLARLIAEAAPKVAAALEEVGDFVVKEARDRAPIDEGILVGSIEHEVYAAQGIVAVRVPINAPAAKYAVLRHEDMSYALGPNSARKQAREGVVVGPKYITRAIDENKDAIREIVAEHMKH